MVIIYLLKKIRKIEAKREMRKKERRKRVRRKI